VIYVTAFSGKLGPDDFRRNMHFLNSRGCSVFSWENGKSVVATVSVIRTTFEREREREGEREREREREREKERERERERERAAVEKNCLRPLHDNGVFWTVL